MNLEISDEEWEFLYRVCFRASIGSYDFTPTLSFNKNETLLNKLMECKIKSEKRNEL